MDDATQYLMDAVESLRQEVNAQREETRVMHALLNEYIGSVRTIVEQVGPAVTVLMQSPIMKMLGGKATKGQQS